MVAFDIPIPDWTTAEYAVHPMPSMPLLGQPPRWNDHPVPAQPLGLGRSWLGNEITLHHAQASPVLVMGGVHGDETEGIVLAHLLLASGYRLPVLPCLNPDGALLHQRWNRNNIDLNRNLPSSDWEPRPRNPRYPPGAHAGSEPETQAFLKALAHVMPHVVLSLHSYKESFVEIELPEQALAPPLNHAVERFVNRVGIEKKGSIGYPTPGALGAYGRENGLLILTYELLRGSTHSELAQLLPALLTMLAELRQAV